MILPAKFRVDLIPFDPESPQHVERLYQQRLACGWKENMIEDWRIWQRDGKVNFHWVTIPSTSPLLAPFITQHVNLYPSESSPIYDTASINFLVSRTSCPGTAFHPIGHVSLDSTHEFPELADPAQGVYCVSALYISRALHNSGLGRAAMLAVEELAKGEPLYAKTLTLGTVAKEAQVDEDKCRAFGVQVPKFLNQDWYERMGYVVFFRKPDGWVEIDPTGKGWPVPIIGMRKEIGQEVTADNLRPGKTEKARDTGHGF